mmetsp:Transcript_18646/g.46800  ORF Transcript_18646/g.46800 Transcript_18646/m.46800 type:complete len:216 (+) Transcript_18646:80-727(+)
MVRETISKRVLSALKTYHLTHVQSFKSFYAFMLKFTAIETGFEHCRKIFNEADTDKTNSIDFFGLKACLAKAGLPADEDTLLDVFEVADVTHFNKLSFKEFIVCLVVLYLLKGKSIIKKVVQDDHCVIHAFDLVLNAYLLLDQNLDGSIDRSEAVRAMTPTEEKGGSEMDAAFSKIFEDMDCDHSGRVSFEEFVFAVEQWTMLDDEDEGADDQAH